MTIVITQEQQAQTVCRLHEVQMQLDLLIGRVPTGEAREALTVAAVFLNRAEAELTTAPA